MKKKVTAIFDIGKTNKKFFLFDKDYQAVYREYTSFKTIADEDGYPTDDLEALTQWMKEVMSRILASEEFDLKAINISAYGASFVHVNTKGEVVAPLYNYTKPFAPGFITTFYQKYGPEKAFVLCTGSDNAGMLNSGLQLFWLKYTKPEVFAKIKYSLHLPQYLSFIFTGIPLSEYTSIGCHTGLWDYFKGDYHHWVYQEQIDKILAPIVSTGTSVKMVYNGKKIKVGVGIHDSSAALLPYIKSVDKPFVLVSTGTWSVALNPFTTSMLTSGDMERNCINYMRTDGKAVRASRLFLGNEYTEQLKVLSRHFQVSDNHHQSLKFDQDIFLEIENNFSYSFRWISITDEDMPIKTTIPYTTYEQAYHQLMIELVLLQLKTINAAIGNDQIERLYLDGGFSDNEVYVKLISYYLKNMKLMTTNAALGSALGAAIVISDAKLKSKFLKKNYALKKHRPFIINPK